MTVDVQPAGEAAAAATNGIYMALNCTFAGYEFLQLHPARLDSQMNRIDTFPMSYLDH